MLENGIASDEGHCEIKPAWGAAVCQGDFGTFSIAGNLGFGSEPIPNPVMLSRNGRRWEYNGQSTIRNIRDRPRFAVGARRPTDFI